MSIIGIGTDLVEVERIKKAIEKSSKFVERVYTLSEIDYCESKANKYESYAARFSAKEAFFKAMGTGWAEGLDWKDFSVEVDEKGKPFGVLSDSFLSKGLLGSTRIHLSLSHTKEYAIAYIILEK